MRYIYTLLLLTGLVLWSSCRNDFETTPSTGNLRFSKDTVYLDTVFTNIGSSTYNLKVYNDSDEAISIPSVRLGRGENSNYRLNVDGIPGRIFNEVEILAKDSIFIFVETTVDIETQTNEDEFLYTDIIEFNNVGNTQKVDLVTLVQDAIFLFPDRDGATGMIETLTVNDTETEIRGRFLLDDELTFTNEKPYVVYGYMAVGDPNGNDAKELTINPGARIHFHADSGLLIADNASLKVNGGLSTDPEALENEVIFEGDRLEPGFAEVPGQWGTILLTDGSVDNVINHATIKNATVGILNESITQTGNPNLSISNTQIYNSSAVGLLNRLSDVEGHNVVINNSGQFSLLVQLGGSYNFSHCTFANYWANGIRNTPSVFIDNTFLDSVSELTQANFSNCIIYGNQPEELMFNSNDLAGFNYNFENTLIRFEDTFGNFEDNPLYDFQNTSLFENIILNELPDFKNPQRNELQIGLETPGRGLGNISTAAQFPLDLIGSDRTASPDFGAYQSIEFPDEE